MIMSFVAASYFSHSNFMHRMEIPEETDGAEVVLLTVRFLHHLPVSSNELILKVK